MATAILQLDRLWKRYRGRPVVRDLSLLVQPGEAVGLLGPNGAGKTTTLRMILGLVEPSGGEVFIRGHSVRRERSRALAAVGAVVEESRFYGYLSGRENLLQACLMRGLPSTRLAESLAAVGLTQAADRPVREYSLGMRQRLALALALLQDPQLLILDEPMNGLDPAAIQKLRQHLVELTRRGVALLLSSHLLSEVEQVCRRVVLIDQGSLIGEEPLGGEGTVPPTAFAVDDPPRAVAVLAAAGIPARVGENTVTASLPRQEIPGALRALLDAQVAVYGATAVTVSLEERYLAITRQKNPAPDGEPA
ncbi:MAG: ABC transporter ATP-binding protein [Thermaerobacter sp.]|nr:ABC transporter ATP-binding protein [Thermaerobacter sp.]